jgi:hypothetical protein
MSRGVAECGDKFFSKKSKIEKSKIAKMPKVKSEKFGKSLKLKNGSRDQNRPKPFKPARTSKS